MTAIALVFGSILGFIAGVVGWVFWDMSIGSAFGVYLGTALGFGLFTMVTLAQISGDRTPEAQPQVG